MALRRLQSHIETLSHQLVCGGRRGGGVCRCCGIAGRADDLVAHQACDRQRKLQRQAQIASSGASCRGAVAAIQRPFMLDACTRVYFDFKPEGSSQLLRACHTIQGPEEAFRKSLPPIGAVVTVRYQPDRPHEAVLLSLAPRLSTQELAS